MLMAMYSTLAERKLPLGFKIVSVLTELEKVDFTTSCRWFKIISKEEFEPIFPTDFILQVQQ
jgi:indole-3-glycerol phosphate synthase